MPIRKKLTIYLGRKIVYMVQIIFFRSPRCVLLITNNTSPYKFGSINLSVTYEVMKCRASWWLSGKESVCQCRRCKFSSWLRKIPQRRRKRQPTPVFLPGKSHGQRLKRVGQSWAMEHTHNAMQWPGIILYIMKPQENGKMSGPKYEIHLDKTPIQKDTCTPLCIAVLFTIIKVN